MKDSVVRRQRCCRAAASLISINNPGVVIESKNIFPFAKTIALLTLTKHSLCLSMSACRGPPHSTVRCFSHKVSSDIHRTQATTSVGFLTTEIATEERLNTPSTLCCRMSTPAYFRQLALLSRTFPCPRTVYPELAVYSVSDQTGYRL